MPNISLLHRDIKLPNDITIKLRKSQKAKRIILKVKKDYGELVIPKRVSIKSAINFAKLKQDWLSEKLASQHTVSFKEGAKIRIFEREYKIIYSDQISKGVSIEGDKLIYGSKKFSELRIKRFLARLLKERIITIADDMILKLRVNYQTITIREMSTRLGSCSSTGRISFSLKLIFMTEFVLKYVVAHEISHLVEMNHSKNFWLLVGKLFPDWKIAKKWLKENGQVVL